MQSRAIQRRQSKGWGFSLLLHGILLGATWPIFHHLPSPLHPEPFQWDVAFVESPQQTNKVEPPNDASSAKGPLQTVEAGEKTPALSPPDLPSSAQQSKNKPTESLRESDPVKPMIAELPPIAFARAQAEISQPMTSTTEPTPAIQETLPDEQSKANMAATPVRNEPSARPMAPIEQDLPSTPASSVADAAMTPAQSWDTPSAPPSPVPSANSAQASGPRADYSWLQRAVSHRLEELKRSSRPSLDDSSPLKVLVKAVVSNTGELMEAEVVKSSGLNRIDQEAMTLVQRAFPVPLDRALDRQQIVMRIPITYSRD
jgi:TonB family protein